MLWHNIYNYEQYISLKYKKINLFEDLFNCIKRYRRNILHGKGLGCTELGQYPHLPPIEHVQIFINYVKFIINESLIRKKIIKRNLEFYDRRVPKRKAKAQETAEQWQARLNRESERKRAQVSEKNV
ncbi:unnamed protein product [Rhizophagus irregularis]|nr:unnamed protein product [Rhizophagus irregularis]